MFNRDGGSEPPVGIYVPQAMYDDFVKICAPIKQIRPDYPFEIKLREPRSVLQSTVEQTPRFLRWKGCRQ